MILERILPILSDRKRNYSMHVHRRIKPERNWGTYWIKSNACITLTKELQLRNCNKLLNNKILHLESRTLII